MLGGTAPNPSWPSHFLRESEQILQALGPHAIAVHHIGSTAIRAIFAKPVIDMLLITTDLQLLEQSSPAMVKLGYEIKGEFGIPGRRYFRKNSPAGLRTHQLHAFEVGSPHVERHLVFRDYMNSHPAAAAAYSDLKRRLANDHPRDPEAYMDGKDAFIKHYESIALEWARAGQGDA